MDHADQRSQVFAVHLISRWDLPACSLETLSGSEGLKGAGKHPYQGLGMRPRDKAVLAAVLFLHLLTLFIDQWYKKAALYVLI